MSVVVKDPSSAIAKEDDDAVLDDPSKTGEKDTDALPPKPKRLS